MLTGWAKGDSVPLPTAEDGDDQRQFAIIGTFNYTGGGTKEFTAQFNPDTDSSVNWQYVAQVMVAEEAYTSITVELAYDYNANTVSFDGIQLFRERFGASYTYDDNGNVTSVVDLQNQTTTYEYTDNDLTAQVLPTGARLEYTYDDYHNVIQATTEEGLVYNFTYDTYGNNTAVSISGGEGAPVITSTATYSDDGSRLVSTTDAVGNVTTYQYNADTNVLEWVKYPQDTDTTKTTYTYDTMYRMATAAAATDTGLSLSASYTYENDLLSKIETESSVYSFDYGTFSLRESVSVGGYTLAEYTYTDDRNYYLQELAYGNGDRVEYTYDDHGRVTKQTYEDGSTVSYAYDNSGALATVTDSATGITTTYYYDFLDRMMKYVESGTGYSHSVGYGYDTINNLTSLVETINGTQYTTSYAYDDDNRITSVTNGTATKEYTYDTYGRTGTQTTKNGETTVKTDSFTFTAPTDSTISGQISGHTIDLNGTENDKTYTYTYDDNGNILSISDGTNTTSYVYDSANQLVRENNQAGSFTHTWTYDSAGNITARTEYAYTTGELGTPTDTVAYTYGNTNWGDLLTAYDGTAFTYETTSDGNTIGNLLSDGTWTYTWQHGRQLASMYSDNGTVDDASDDVTWTYTYNADGMRTKRTNGAFVYEYVYNGSQLSRMTVSHRTSRTLNTLYFAYDASGTPMAVTYNNTVYYYVTNIQGDVIAITDNTGLTVATYDYDAWGNILSTDGTMKDTLGTHNPLRYRSYVYDQETSLYYLQSRYYNSKIGRFINADALVATGQGFIGNNMFVYCLNNPVLYLDEDGKYTSLPPMIENGLNLPASGGIPVVIDGVTYYYAISYSSSGQLYEYWFDVNGDLVWVRHNCDHGTPEKHEDPHDHRGGKDKDGNNTLITGPLKKNEKFQPPDKSVYEPNSSQALGYTLTGAALGIALYQIGKWALAIVFAGTTGGGSLGIAASMP